MGSDKVEEIIERVRKARTAEELRKTAEEAIRWEEMDPGMEREVLEEMARIAEGWDEKLGIEALRIMEGSKSQDLPLILGRMAEDAKEKGVRKEARRLLHKLRSKGVKVGEGVMASRKGGEAIAPKEGVGIEAYSSPIIAPRLSHIIAVVNIEDKRFMAAYISYRLGGIIKEILVADSMRVSRRNLREIAVKGMEDMTGEAIEVPHEYASWLVNLSWVTMKRMGVSIPGKLYRARPDLIGYEEPDRAYIYTIFDPKEIRLEEFQERLGDLGTSFPYRGFPEEKYLPILEKYWDRLDEKVLILPEWREEELEEGMIVEATKEIFADSGLRNATKRTLEELAFLSYIKGHKEGARLFTAAAISIEEIPPEENEFLKGMVWEMLFGEEEEEEGILYLPSLKDIFGLGMVM
jgi:hypothetical protein